MNTRRIVWSTVLVGVCALIVIVGVATAGNGSAPRDEALLTQPASATRQTMEDTLEDVLEQAKQIGASLERHPLAPVSLPPGWACPGTENIQNVHVRLGPLPEHFNEGKAMGMSDDQARSYAAGIKASQQAMQEQMLATIATLPPPPCP